MPICLSFDFVRDGATIYDRGTMWISNSASSCCLIFNLLHIKAIFVADLLVQRGRRRAIANVLGHLAGLLAIATCQFRITCLRVLSRPVCN